MLFNFVEAVADEQVPAPCVHGNIVVDHACYCHHEQGPRKCPIWRNYTLCEPDKWCVGTDVREDDEWEGGCPFFEPNKDFVWKT